ncbi:MAG: penicillin-binding protein activator LpoB [Alphaproteobacteria bacterium]|nr:penicillin-binding protein activator LpoB [Alphaproteobacteria bacterium]
MNKIKCLMPYALCLMLCACGGTKVIDTNDSKAVSGMSHVMELEYRDWTNTAEEMVNSMFKSGGFARIKDPVIAMGPMINDTQQRFDTDILTKKIRSDLVNSGRAQIATNFGGEDTTSNTMRDMRGNSEYAANSFAGKGTLVAPNMSLSGKMLQRNLKLDSGWFDSKNERVEYYLQLTLTDLKTGLSVWENEQPILKEGKRAPRW